MFFFFDKTMMLLIPAVLLAWYAQMKVRSTYRKYSQVPSQRGWSGAQAAQRVLEAAGLSGVTIEETPGRLSDHYDPRSRKLRLSRNVYEGRSLAALGVAAHEASHAIQHASGYIPLNIRSMVVPVARFGTNGAWILFLLGFLARRPSLMGIAILLFSFGVFFYLVTLPVEFNASSRAIKVLVREGIIERSEIAGTKKVLSAAALTYVAAALMAVLQLIRLILLRNSRN